MVIVTTLNYTEFAAFIKNKSVALNNSALVFGENYTEVKRYLEDRLGCGGYVMGIRGRINQTSAKLLAQLDPKLANDRRLILETPVDDRDALVFNVKGLEEAIEILTYGLPEDVLREHLDNSIDTTDSNDVKVICVPAIFKSGDVKITSLNSEVSVDSAGITFVKLNGGSK